MAMATASVLCRPCQIAVILSIVLISSAPIATAFRLPSPEFSGNLRRVMTSHRASAADGVENAQQQHQRPGSHGDGTTATIPAERLLSTLVDAATRGSLTISSLSETARGSGATDSIRFKVEGDARSALTIADTAAQRVIVSCLLGAHPGLNIVGEEDESVGTAEEDASSTVGGDLSFPTGDPLDGCDWAAPPQPTADGDGDDPPRVILPAELDMRDVLVYVDPLDGTREFVEGRLENVTCLIGACYRGRPVMGAIGLPFQGRDGDGDDDGDASPCEVIFGLAGRGVGRARVEKKTSGDGGASVVVGCARPKLKRHRDGDTIRISSGDSSSVLPALDLADRTFESKGGIARQIYGATGNKLLKVIYGRTTLSLLHTKTSLWDTAAPTAVLEAMGGRVTDYFGEPLVYGDGHGGELGNRKGVVASAPGAGAEHDEMCEAMCDNAGMLNL